MLRNVAEFVFLCGAAVVCLVAACVVMPIAGLLMIFDGGNNG